MAKYDIGPRLGIEGEKEFRKAIENINSNIRTLGTEMLAVTSAYDANDKSVAALTSQNKVLVKQIDAQKDKLAKLQEGLEASTTKYGENTEITQKWQQTVNVATANLNKMERQLADNNQSLEDLKNPENEAAESTRKLGDSMEETESSAKGLHDTLSSVVSGLGKLAAAAGAAVAAAGAAVAGFTKTAVESYAQSEQLVGGVETLFKESSGKVLEYANNAYKTAGMSANEYMESVTGFSASLLQGLGGDTEKAADIANLALIDMADNANKLGSDMSSIQTAYQGFAKQNYSMLDNLKLGYGGTKDEMVRLINDSGILTEQISNLDNISFDQIIEAIHAVQTNMGITGATAQEASTTIEGSLSAVKSAYGNLLSGIGSGGQNLDMLINNLTDSVLTAANNIVPVVETVLANMGAAITALTPIITEELPQMVENILPSLLEAGVSLLGGLAEGITSALPVLTEAAMSAVGMLTSGILDTLPRLAEASVEIISTLAEGIKSGVPQLVEGAIFIMTNLGQYLQENMPIIIQSGLEAISSFTGSLRENAGLVVDGAIELAKSLAQGLADSIPTIIENVPTIVSNIANTINDNAPKILKAGVDIIGTLVKGLIDAIPTIIENMPKIIAAVWDTVTAVNWVNLGGSVVKGIGNGISGMVQSAKNAIGTVKDALKNGVQALPEAFKTIGKNAIQGLVDGIKGMVSSAVENAKALVTSVVSGVKDFLGIHSPSTLFKEEIGENIGLGVAEGISDSSDEAVKAANKLAKDVYERSKTWADRQTKYQKFTLQEQLELWETIQGQFIEESEQYAEAEEKIFDLKSKMQDEYVKKVEEVNKKITSLEKEYQDAVSKRTQEIFNSYKLFDQVAERKEVSGQELVFNLQDQVTSMMDFYHKLQQLSARGVGDDLVEEIRAMGPSAAGQLDALLKLSDQKLSEYANLYKIKQHLANQQAVEELRDLREETNRQIQESISEISDVYGQNATELGESFTIGLANGMLSGLDVVTDAAKTATNEAVEASGQAISAVIKSVGGIEYKPDVDYSKMMLAAKDLNELEELAVKRNAKIIGENIDLIEKGYSDNAQLLEQWKDMQTNAQEQAVQTVDTLVSTVSDTLRSFLDDTPELGRQFSENLADGIRSGISSAASAAADVARAIADAFNQALSIDFGDEMASVQRRIDRSMEEMAWNASASVQVSGNVAGAAVGGSNYAPEDLPEMIAEAVSRALDGTSVNLNMRKVGEMTTRWQDNNARSRGD